MKYSLQTLVATVAALCLCLGVLNPLYEQRQRSTAAGKLEALGALVDESSDGTSIITFRKLSTQDTNEFVESVSQLKPVSLDIRLIELSREQHERIFAIPSLKKLRLFNTSLNAEDLSDLSGSLFLPKLSSLAIQQSPIGTDVTWKAMAPNLEELDLEGTKLQDSDLFAIWELESLVSLNISRTYVTGTGLRHLVHLKDLRNLEFAKKPRSGIGTILDNRKWGDPWTFDLELCDVPLLPKLTSLDVSGARMNLKSFEWISMLPNLKALSIKDSTVTSQALSMLVETKIVELDLSGSILTPNMLKEIAQFPELRTLRIEECDLPRKGWAHLGDSKRLTTISLGDYKIPPGVAKAMSKIESLKTVIAEEYSFENPDDALYLKSMLTPPKVNPFVDW